MRKPIQYGIVQTGNHVPEGVPCVRVVDITKSRVIPSEMARVSIAIHERYRKTTLEEDDVLFALRGDIGTVYRVPASLSGANIHRGVARLATDPSQLTPAFLVETLQSLSVSQEIAKRTNGSALQELPITQLRLLSIPVPPLQEQGEIARMLAGWTAAISITHQLLGAKGRFKRDLMQEILTRKRRFGQFATQEWRGAPLGEWLAEFSAVQGNGAPLEVLSCTKRGIVLQRDRFSKRMASRATHRYKVVSRGDFVYDPMLLWDGSMGFVDVVETGVVSPAYVTLSFRGNESEKGFVTALLHSPPIRHGFKVISQGTNQRRRKALPKDFLAIACQAPSSAGERARIGELARLLDDEMLQLQRLRAAFHRQRRSVAELLLTGKVRTRQ